MIDPRLILGSAAAAMCLLVAVLFLFALRRLTWRTPPLPTGSAPSSTVSVIIPARNEAADIGRSIASILAQEDVNLEVIIVNDHSTDQTGAIADAAAAADRRVKVIHDPDLPPGWLGKCNAMQQAAALARNDLLLFSDGDIIHHPRCLATACDELERSELDFLSLFPEMQSTSLWENIVVPTFIGGVTLLATPGIEDPASPDALGAGAFLLVRSRAFRAVGGFEPIRGEMADDLELARLLKTSGYRVRIRFAPEFLKVRIYKGNRHAFWAMTKNILIGIRGRLWLAPAVMVLPIFAFWIPLYCLVAGVVEANAALALLGAAGYLITYASIWSGRRLFPFHPVKAMLYACRDPRVLLHGTRALPLSGPRRGRVARALDPRPPEWGCAIGASETKCVAPLDRDRVD